MSTLGVITGRTIARTGVVLMARVVGASNANITQATLSSISYLVRDIDAGSSGSVTALTIASVVFDTLQTGNGWDQDATGYNFRAILPASAFAWTPEVDAAANPKPHRFQVEVRFTPSSGEQFVIVFGLFVHPTWIS